MRKYNFLFDVLSVISHEIRPLVALYSPPRYKKCFIRLLSVVAGGGMLMPTAFAFAKRLISRDITFLSTLHHTSEKIEEQGKKERTYILNNFVQLLHFLKLYLLYNFIMI